MSIEQEIMDRYCFYRKKYVIMTEKRIRTVHHSFTDKVITSHLGGYYSLSVFAGEKATRFISIDVDAGGPEAVRKVMAALEELGIPHDKIYVSTSGRKGYHVDMFFEPYLYNNTARNLYNLMIWRSELDPKKIEFRPTNTQAIKIPLGVHVKTGNKCWYLDRDTLEPIEDEAYIYGIETMEADGIKEIVKKWNKVRWNELREEISNRKSPAGGDAGRRIEFDDTYYEGKRLVASGTRHNTMVEIAKDLRTYGAGLEQIESALVSFYEKQSPSMIETSEKEVLRDIREIAGWAERCVEPRHEWQPLQLKRIYFTAEDIDRILGLDTKAARKVAFLIFFYSKIYGSGSYLSFNRISDVTGCTAKTAQKAVAKMLEQKMIQRESGGCHYSNGRMVVKANKYQIIPVDKYDKGLSYPVMEKITPDNFDRIYYGVLAGLCTDEYLRARLTKGEMEAIADARGCADDSAGRDDAGLQDVCAG